MLIYSTVLVAASLHVELSVDGDAQFATEDASAAIQLRGSADVTTDLLQLSTLEGMDTWPKNSAMLVAYLSGSARKFAERRAQVRTSCFPKIREAGVDVKFFVGRPSHITPGSHESQGARATQEEIDDAEALLQESEEHGDIVIVPFRDMYRDLSDKVTHIFQRGVALGYDVVLKIDDDMCPSDMSHINAVTREMKPEQGYYIGQYEWAGSEYPGMIGPDGSTAKYMSGVCFLLSRVLSEKIFLEDEVHTMLFAPYGTDSDDANMGKWFDYAREKHPDVSFHRRVEPNLCTPTK
jgi:hypothetical protein